MEIDAYIMEQTSANKEAPKGASCWKCIYRKDKQMLIFGECTYFLKIKKPAKEIPSNIVNKGCNYFADKDNHHPVVQKILTLFDGEFLPEENNKKGKYVYNKKIFKSKNKYAKRADWDG